MYRGFRQQLADGPGYRIDHLLMMSFDPTLLRYTDAQSTQFFEQVAERARDVAGVKAVTMTTWVPMTNAIDSETLVPEGFQFPPGKDNASVLASGVDEHYFDTMGITILEGRSFRRDDSVDAPRVAIVNQQFAQRYWPNQDPIGKRIRLVDRDGTWFQVVGLAKTSKYIFIAEPPTEFVYFPYRQKKVERMIMLVQSAGDPSSLAAVHRLDANLPIYNVRTMEALYRMRGTSIINVLVGTVAAMGLLGLGLAIVGLYGLVAYAVSRRTREIGIRMAIGADRAAVLRLVLGQGLVLAVVGLLLGLAASVAAGKLLMAAFPMGDNERDVAALFMVVPLVLAVTFLATYVPARRASRVNPMQALHYE